MLYNHSIFQYKIKVSQQDLKVLAMKLNYKARIKYS